MRSVSLVLAGALAAFLIAACSSRDMPTAPPAASPGDMVVSGLVYETVAGVKAPVADAEISVWDGTDLMGRTTANAQGRYQFAPTNPTGPGYYSLTAIKAGFDQMASVRFLWNGTTSADIEVRRIR